MSAKATTRTATLSLTADAKTRLAWAVLLTWAIALVASVATTFVQGGDVAANLNQPVWALGVITFTTLFLTARSDEQR
ncbi:hypothetical protein MM440_06605 [Arsenicicoccus piscis]|uniref:Uncharacterized protein n=1 Tax=Arsenicicoccus piscis TaxID=673954 RepID=A0ABQ6HTB0_9MICO|nr:hypothetical protein [Arsenicicoccus piscis]MCH8627461.1 hypothetical protein [Arsenicicoccus piscis]GMA21627.1 hypothetical protein GCM10025862_36480 [Arsenicicoccus piscis]